MKRAFYILPFIFCAFSILHARIITSVQNGNWSDPNTWDCSCTPSDGDTVVIASGTQVNVDINSPVYDNMRIEVYGILWFNNGKKINMTANGVVQIYAGGMIDGGNGGSKIVIDGDSKWDGNDGPVSGPAYVDSSTPEFTPGVLPVKLLYFNAELTKEGTVEISWATATEINNDYFIVEKSTNGITYEVVEEIKGAGNSNAELHYVVTDHEPHEGTAYYRLKQIDFDGQTEVFEVVAVNYMKDENTNQCVLTIYPNPCDAFCNVVLSDCARDNHSQIILQILDANGKLITTTYQLPALDNGFRYQIDTHNLLVPGLYYIKINQDEKQLLEKLIVK